MIDLQHLSVGYPGADGLALNDVSLAIADGEHIAVMGENGSGKSTLVRSLNGILQPSSGRVTVDGWNANNPSHLRSIRERLGIVFQNPRLQTTSLTVEREIAFGLQNIGVQTEEIGARVEEQLTASGLAHLRRQAPRMLSGGEQQRLALAAILAMRPRHLVLDEATSLLSPSSRALLLTQVADERHRRGVTLILVTQFAAEARDADRLIVLHRGRITYDGAPAHFLASGAPPYGDGIRSPLQSREGSRA